MAVKGLGRESARCVQEGKLRSRTMGKVDVRAIKNKPRD